MVKDETSDKVPSWSIYHTPYDPYLKTEEERLRGYPDPDRYFEEKEQEWYENYCRVHKEEREESNIIYFFEDKKDAINFTLIMLGMLLASIIITFIFLNIVCK
jgi:hypothetical protein